MRITLLLSFLTMSFCVKSQKVDGRIILKVEAYYDTITNYKESVIKIKIINNSALPLLISDMLIPYYEIVSCDDSAIDTITSTVLNSGSIDYMTKEKFEIIEPLTYHKYNCGLYDGFFKKEGNYKLKFYLDLGRLNKCNTNKIESEWINIYVKKIDFLRY